MKSLSFSHWVVMATVALCAPVYGANIFAPGDTIFGGASDGTDFVVGVAGTAATVNNWPAGESPDHAIDGVGQKYLNFAEVNTGFLVTPAFNGGNGSIVTGMTLWTANDAVDRDPASYALYGSNEVFSGGGPFALTSFSLISSGDLALPATRNAGGAAALDPANSQTVGFANTNLYTSYLVLFPTVKNEAANSMQIAEVQLDGVVPEPGALALLSVGGLALLLRRRRR
ncbi:MAG TPA: PEP-CTERM sorting domain-containing protein [Verrucomicrobiales bacterium]|nr:PEP-CTERM sorting domain-containing protein [Verrucomicrobiales bacterium]